MRLVELKTHDGGPSIWVNPASVAFIERSGGGSEVFFSAIASGDAVLARRVALPPDKLAELLNVALRGS
jgi:hypothetical protein